MLYKFLGKADETSYAHCLGMNYYVNFLGGTGSNEFHIK